MSGNLSCCLSVFLAAAAPALGQAVKVDNAVTAAEDAFGVSVGPEQLGLYSSSAVRGFSPLDAGNMRLDGLYIDRQAEFTGRLVTGNAIRVGLSALGFPSPAPTGVVDFHLRRPGQSPAFKTAGQVNSFGAALLEFDAELPLHDTAALAAGGGIYWNSDRYKHRETVTSVALVPHWTPTESLSITPLWGRIDKNGQEARPLIMMRDGLAPPRIPRRHFFGQPWTEGKSTHENLGLIVDSDIGKWKLKTGLFNSVLTNQRSYSDLLLNTGPDGWGDRIVIANPQQKYRSNSGEIRLSRQFTEAQRQHTVHLSAKGRDQSRRYGGGARIALGRTRLGEATAFPEPDYTFGAQSRDTVRQWSAGVAYEGRWPGVGRFSGGIQRVDYRKSVTQPQGQRPDSNASLWLYNGMLEAVLSPAVSVYAGYTSGLEESPVAPETAVNRDEAPPAIETSQIEAGIRWNLGHKLQLVAGVFEVEKPYFGLDAARYFRNLGDVRHQGAEVSLRAEPLKGLSVVAGAVVLDAEVSNAAGTQPADLRPVGVADRTAILNVEYQLPMVEDLSFDLALEHQGKRMANRLNTLELPANTLATLGLRYQLNIAGNPAVLRVMASNLLNAYELEVTSSEAFTAIPPRNVSVRLTSNF